MTVSKALRDEPDVSEATKARIKSLAQQMGYVPDSSAQGLRTRTTRLLGLLIPSTTDAFLARTVLAIEERAHDLVSAAIAKYPWISEIGWPHR